MRRYLQQCAPTHTLRRDDTQVVPYHLNMKLKTNKSISKRFRVTKNGKVLKRREGQDHFNARNTGNQTRRKRRDVKVSEAHRKVLQIALPYKNV